ncbi:acyltransferase family protein [Streptacidiphilus sp. N1-12]|uniref:Acyltransferase family protein n=2 Tax=Streptacidiphilus alkalitolerans TaxID=3342712 RepID=A0ABV6WCQ5_9ACTN
MTTTDQPSIRPLPEPAQPPGSAEPAKGSARPPRLAAVDLLRLVAALAVASFHYMGTNNPAFWGVTPHDFAFKVHRASMYGWLGVEAFFLISGFVICMSAWGRTPGQFAVSRLSRLFPAYWCAIILIVLVTAVTLRDSGQLREILAPRAVVANLSMAPGPMHVGLLDGVAWTLWVEGRFYLIMAAVLVFGFTYRRMMAFCTIWLAVAVIAGEIKNTMLDEVALTPYAGLFVAGITLYLMYRFGQNLMLWMLMGLAWTFQLTMMNGRVLTHGLDYGTSQHVSWSFCALLLTGFLGLLMLSTIGPLARLRWRWLVTAGALTYPFYLVHQSIGVPLAKELTAHVPGLSPWPTVTLALAAMLGLSWLMNRLVENPFGRVMRRHLANGLNAGEVLRTRS